MKIFLTEEAKNMLIPLIVRSSKGAEDIFKITPAELLCEIEELGKHNITLSKQKGFWQGLAITTSIAGAYYIYKNFKLKCKVSKLEDEVDEYAIKEAIYESEEA